MPPPGTVVSARAVRENDLRIETTKALGFKSPRAFVFRILRKEAHASRAKSVAPFAPWWEWHRQEIRTSVLT
jgi:hypothetical protein